MASSLDLIQQAILDLPESDAPHLDARWLLAALLDVPHNDPSLRTDLPRYDCAWKYRLRCVIIISVQQWFCGGRS